MDFTGPDVYNGLKITRDEKKYAISTLPAGSTVYRADREGKKSPSEGVPNFFSDKVSITPYTGNNRDTISSYTTKKDAKLFVLSYMNICKLGVSDKEIEGFVSTCYLGEGIDRETEQRFLFLKPTTPLEQGNPKNYANRKFAEIVCAQGYDGWIAFPNTLEQRNIDRQHYEKTGEIRPVINPYYPEIVICKWNEIMDYKGGYKMPRKMTRKYCKKTSCKKMGFTQKASCRPWKNCYRKKK